jgi:hypothetical protein
MGRPAMIPEEAITVEFPADMVSLCEGSGQIDRDVDLLDA